jgi:hypothetical protein
MSTQSAREIWTAEIEIEIIWTEREWKIISAAIYRSSIGASFFFIRRNARTSKFEMESLTDARERHVALQICFFSLINN